MNTNHKSLFFIATPAGDVAAFYKGPELFGDQAFPLIILSHGFGAGVTMAESARLFYDTASFFAKAGMGALMFDCIGHGVSDGSFADMTPLTRIRDLSAVLEWALARHRGPVFLLGLSMGAAVSIHVAERYQENLAGLVTWSAVASFDPGHPAGQWFLKDTDAERVFRPSPAFATDRPQASVGDAYRRLRLPKLQIQGTDDLPHFASAFQEFYEDAPAPKDYVLLADGDHTFTNSKMREDVIRRSADWMKAIAQRAKG